MMERLELWNAGQFETLRQTSLELATYRANITPNTREKKQTNLRRTMRLAKEGTNGKAAQDLGVLSVLLEMKALPDALSTNHPL